MELKVPLRPFTIITTGIPSGKEHFMNIIKWIAVFLITCPTFVSANTEPHVGSPGHCLRYLHETFRQNKVVYNTAALMLLKGSSQDRENLLTLCSAFYDQPDDFAQNVQEMINGKLKRPVWGTPLHNGTVFKSLPGTRNWWYQLPTGPVQGSIGDFVDVDNDGDLDYVVAVYYDGDVFGLGKSYYYRATYINVGNGWTMNHCESNMQSVFNKFPFLVVPCPNL